MQGAYSLQCSLCYLSAGTLHKNIRIYDVLLNQQCQQPTSSTLRNLTISSIKFFSEIKTEYPDMFYHTTIQWLSNGIVLFKFFKLRVETEIVLNKKNPLNHCYWTLNGFGN